MSKLAEMPAVSTATVQQTKEPAQAPPDSAVKPIAQAEKTSFQDFKAGHIDPLAGVVIKEVLARADGFVVYLA